MSNPKRYVLLASRSADTAVNLGQLLQGAGVTSPLVTVITDADGVAAVNDPQHEPPLAVFVDVAAFDSGLRLIGWIVSSPSTRLIPVFAILSATGPQTAEVERFKPTLIISHPLQLHDVSACVALCPLLQPGQSDEPPPSRRPPRFMLLGTL
jgi:hypothetical protein